MSLLVDESANELYDEPADMSYSHDDEFNTDAYFAYNVKNPRPTGRGAVMCLHIPIYDKTCSEVGIEYKAVVQAAKGSMQEFNKFWAGIRTLHPDKLNTISLLKKQYIAAMKVEYDYGRIIECFHPPIEAKDIELMQQFRNSILRTLHSNLLTNSPLKKTFWMQDLSPTMDVQKFENELKTQLTNVRIHIHGSTESIPWWKEFDEKYPKPKRNKNHEEDKEHDVQIQREAIKALKEIALANTKKKKKNKQNAKKKKNMY